MRRLSFLLSFILISAPAFSSESSIHRILVRYKAVPASGRVLAVPGAAQRVSAKMHAASARVAYQAAQSALERTTVVELPAGADLQTEMAQWRTRNDVEFVEPNYPMRVSVTPNDPDFDKQWALKNTGQVGDHSSFDPDSGTVGADVDAESAWAVQTGSTNIIVAIIDTGVALGHEDLVDNLASGYDFGSLDGTPEDDCLGGPRGHGTHVAGIAGARGNNNKGISGISWASKIMPLKVAKNSCLIETSEVVLAINYAVANNANVINISLGGEASSALKTAVEAAITAGVVVVAAAGNESTESTTESFPAAYSTIMDVISVAATDREDSFASFSNRGDWITLSAPGVGIRSTVPFGNYGYLSGTSMASPLVAGTAALLLSDNPALTPAQVKERLVLGCENIDALNPAYVGKMGAGRLNALNTLFSVTAVSPSTAPNTGVSPPINVYGFNFSGGMSAFLARGTQTISGLGLVVQSSTWATVTFDLINRPGGRWDVTLVNVGGSSTTLADGFAVLSSSFNVLTLSSTQMYTSTISVVQGTHTIVWPIGVFSQDITLDVDAAPPLVDPDGSIDPFVATHVGIELVSSAPTLRVARPYTLTLGYRLADLPDPNKETALTIAYYNETTGRWESIASTIDTTARTVTASISHLSTFAILQHVAAADLTKALAFPNPFRAQSGHTHVTFEFLTAGSQVRIYDVAGNKVRDLSDEDGDGDVVWNDMKNDGGDDVASGVYFYLITDPSGHKEKGRIGVIR